MKVQLARPFKAWNGILYDPEDAPHRVVDIPRSACYRTDPNTGGTYIDPETGDPVLALPKSATVMPLDWVPPQEEVEDDFLSPQEAGDLRADVLDDAKRQADEIVAAAVERAKQEAEAAFHKQLAELGEASGAEDDDAEGQGLPEEAETTGEVGSEEDADAAKAAKQAEMRKALLEEQAGGSDEDAADGEEPAEDTPAEEQAPKKPAARRTSNRRTRRK